MFTIRNYEYDCTEKCCFREHGNLITAALTKRVIPDDKLAAYIAKICCNFKNNVDDMGRSAMHMASSVDRCKIVNWLLNQGATVSCRDFENGSSPLHRAVYYGCIDSAVLLLRFGANLELLDEDKRTALQNVCRLCDLRSQFDVPSNNDVMVWGSNKNYNLGVGDEEDIHSPQVINFFRKEQISIELVAMGAYHSLFLGKNSQLYAVGHGKGGRLGNGTEISLPLPRKVKLPIKNQDEYPVCISVSRKHSLVLTNSSLVFACGLNEDKQLGVRDAGDKLNVFKQVVTLQDLGVGGLLRVIARDSHSIAYSAKCIYIWGTNHGQFGVGDNIKTIPFPKPMKLPPRTSIQFVEANNYATVCYTKENLILLFYHYQMKIIKPVNYDRLKSISIVGGDDEKSTKGSATALKLLLLTLIDAVFLWYEKTQNYYRCSFTPYFISEIDKIIYKANQVFMLSKGDIYVGKCHQCNISSYQSKTERNRKKSDSNWNHNDKNRTEVNKEQMIRIELNCLANIDRAVDIFCNDDLSASGVLQESCRKYFKLPILRSPEHSLKKLLNDANNSDSIHDVVFHVDGEEFYAHKLIVSSRSNVLGAIVQESLDKHIYLTQKGLSGKMFEVILKYIYTNYLPTEDDIDNFHQSLGPESPSERMGTYEMFLKFIEEFNLTGLTELVQKPDFQAPYAIRSKASTSRLRQNRLRRKDYPKLFDIRIICADGLEIPAHKCILVGRLDYFDMMFTHSWAEQTTINLTTVPYEYMSAIIEFIYTLDVEDFKRKNYSEEYLYNMTVFCDQFFIEPLRRVCEVLILNKISIRKCGDMFEFACFYNCSILKTGCLNFICQNLSRVLARQSLESIDPENLKYINNHYRMMFKEIFDYRTITPSSIAVDDEILLSFVDNFKIDLQEQEGNRIANDREMLKVKPKENKLKERTRQHERDAINSMLDELQLNEMAEAKIKGEMKSKNLRDTEKVCEKLEVEAINWLKVSNKPDIKKKCPIAVPILRESGAIKSDDKQKSELVTLPLQLSELDSGSPLSKKTYSFTLDAFESPRSSEKMSQKQRKRLISAESSGSIGSEQVKPISSPLPISPVSPNIVLNAWGIASSPEACSDNIEDTNSLGNSLRGCISKSPASTSKNDRISGASGSFDQIVEDEKKQREYYQRLRNKSLALTQIEERAISELRAFYNVDNAADENITIERKSMPQTINFATWQKS